MEVLPCSSVLTFFLAWMHVFTVPIQLFVCSPFLNALELYSGEVWPHNKCASISTKEKNSV